MNNHIYLVVKREFLERVRRKSFLITTILTPLLMITLMGLPAVMAYVSGPENKTVAVIDNSGTIASKLNDNGDLHFVATKASVDSAKASEKYDAVLVIGPDINNNPNDVVLFSHESSGMTTEQIITAQIANAIRDNRIINYNIPGLKEIMISLQPDVHLTTIKIGDDDEHATSALLSYILGMFMMMILYMFIILYGQMVMTSIIEEKNNRVLEVVVSSMSPRHLMMGKILGIGAVAITQIIIWSAIVFAFAQWGIPALNQALDLNSTDVELDIVAMMSTLGNTSYIMSLFGYLLLYLAGGYMFYSAIYAAIGSAVDNIQDASQLNTVAMVPVLLALILSISVVNDPGSDMAMWTSLIPFTAPMIMMARLPFGVPTWQILTSLAILYLSTVAMVWFAAKVYRVGIFMYGKKPTLRELIRWSRYK